MINFIIDVLYLQIIIISEKLLNKCPLQILCKQ